MKIAVDAMGGDNAPKAVIEGVMKAVEDFEDLEITLIGDIVSSHGIYSNFHDLRATFYDCFERYMTNSPENTGSSAT